MHDRSLSPGTVLGHFEILERLGAGGFGEVYKARDTKLGRNVAVKVLPEDFLEGDERKARFEREAKVLAALNHPNIAAIYSFEEIPSSSPDSASRHLIVMELVEGEDLSKRLASGPLSREQTLSFGRQIAEALSAAHEKGILHRDVKPANVALTSRGQVKVLDFGIAKLVGSTGAETGAPTLERLTEEGAIFGTLSYMSPEQLLSKPLDQRSDLFSLGIVLFEMATGRLPFVGTSKIAAADAILHAEPRALTDRPVPEKLRPIVRKLLEKDPERRYASAESLLKDLAALEESLGPRKPGGLSRGARIGVVAAAIAFAVLAGWYWRKSSRERWALSQIPEIARLIEAEDMVKAADLLGKARSILPKDSSLEKLWLEATGEATIETDPPGAEVSVLPYPGDPNAWVHIGSTPLRKVRLPRRGYVWRVAKQGFAEQKFLRLASPKLAFRLAREDTVPAEMVNVPVPGGTADVEIPGLDLLAEVPLDDYLIDRTEVTNAAYKKFVDAGGYRKREFWKQPFLRGGRAVPWDEAVAFFLDSTGRPGPATWEAGSLPKGLERHPVGGVSWYEAAAYAEFAGKSLPTVYHWIWAAQTPFAFLIAPGGNFQGAGTVPVGGDASVSGFGTRDMAGNVKEWCWNESASGGRFLLGGGFGEPAYMFYGQDAQSPWDRRPNFGFRCVKVPASPTAGVNARIGVSERDFYKERPVPEPVFAAYSRLYAYDKGTLDARIEETEQTEIWIREKVSFNAAYGRERVTAQLLLPRNAAKPYQTVVYFPTDDGISSHGKCDLWDSDLYDFVPKSGRALLYPIYKGMFERRDGLKSDVPDSSAFYRDHVVAWSKDLGRSLDYLETRNDVDKGKLAYLGVSTGGEVAPVLLAVEPRLRAAILVSGGLFHGRTLPEVDRINFITRVKTPVLMLNGRYDFFFPMGSSLVPMLRLLGTSDRDKRQILYETGHGIPVKERTRESLDWLDKYLGPVKR